MSSPFVAEIRMFGCNFAPTGWAQCDGQLLPISQNTALFSLLGTFYGGDGKSTFALPDLQGSVPIHQGDGSGLSPYFLGQQGGAEFVTLLQSEMPIHTHTLNANAVAGNLTDPSQNLWSPLTGRTPPNLYNSASSPGAVNMNFQQLSIAGSSFPHNNMSPYLVVNFCIAMQGVFPPRT